MSLAHLVPLLRDIPVPVGADRSRVSVTDDLPIAARIPALATAIDRNLATTLIVVPRQEVVDQLSSGLAQFLPAVGSRLHLWTSPDPLPYEQLPHDSMVAARRVRTLAALTAAAGTDPVIITTIRALMGHVREPQSLLRDVTALSVGQRIDALAFVRRLTAMGYRNVSQVDGPGSVSRRGGIVDVFSPGRDEPVRIEWFGDEVDSIRLFDPVSQRSIETLVQVQILPPIEFDLSETDAASVVLRGLDTSALREEVQDEWDRMLMLVEAGDLPISLDLFATAFPGNRATLLDYLPTDARVVIVEPSSVALQLEQIVVQAESAREALEQAGELPLGVERPYATDEDLRPLLVRHPRWMLGQQDAVDPIVLKTAGAFGEVPLFGGDIQHLAEHLRTRTAEGWRVVIATEQSERVRDLLEEERLYPRVARRGGTDISDPPPPGGIEVVHATLTGGFAVLPSRMLVLSDLEVFGLRKQPRPPAPQIRRRQTSIEALKPGSFVVHVDHGVGIFQGLVTRDHTGVPREYLQLDYAQGDRLYIPVDRFDRLTPYESHAGTPRITRLSSTEWARTTARVRRAVREMAWELLQIYAQRELSVGVASGPDTPWDIELEESFPFRETTDQLRAIIDVRGDLEAPQPMDRLVCGDVGYGKTEVALRAAFKVVNSGRQVAVLVPTTILALQHYNTFRERLAPFPARVEMLSRLRSKEEQTEILQSLETGNVDIVIGTHRLLQKDVRFKHLGLLVVDEEQRFGVRHKEYIKQLRSEIDVLTMTATPIPRTLHLALAGIRDLSLISTPPQDRVPTRTFVTRWDDAIVREAVLRELARGGQVYVVHNRVQSIYSLATKLQELVPEATFGVAHGQMDEKELERMVLAFVRHEFDVLICTTIIESGVDIPNANTMVIDNAHALGLTQMYQLRGRVGRGANRAYAYLFYPPYRALSEEAVQRLEAIQEATELGAGFQVAMRDMEIRGAGNILGAEQSGHIAAVGFDLYTTMLQHAVEEIRAGHPIIEPDDVQIDISIDAMIPEDYITDENLRLTMYRTIASAANAERVQQIGDELRDRFGPPPPEVERLLDLVRLRHRATALGMTAIVEVDGEVYMRPLIGSRLDQARLRKALGPGVLVTPNQVRLRMSDVKADVWNAVRFMLDAIQHEHAGVSQAGSTSSSVGSAVAKVSSSSSAEKASTTSRARRA